MKSLYGNTCYASRSRLLERIVTGIPAFREGFTLLRGISLCEVRLGSFFDPRTEENFGETLFPYLLCKGNVPVAALFPQFPGQEPQPPTEPNPEPPGQVEEILNEVQRCLDQSERLQSRSLLGMLDLDCAVERDGSPPGDEKPLRAMLTRLMTLPDDALSGPSFGPLPLTDVPEALTGPLLKLGLLAREGKALVPTEFGADCGLIAACQIEEQGLRQRVVCHPIRTLPYLEGLVRDWLEPKAQSPGAVSLVKRLKRLDLGLYGTPQTNKALFEFIQQAELERMVPKPKRGRSQAGLPLSTGATWAEAGIALFDYKAQREKRDKAWGDSGPARVLIERLCPTFKREVDL